MAEKNAAPTMLKEAVPVAVAPVVLDDVTKRYGRGRRAVTLLTVTRAVTGSWIPFIPFAPAAGLVAVVAALTAGAVMIPFAMMSRREPTLASG